MEQALAGSRQISEVRVTVGYEDGSLNLEAVVLLAGEPVAENVETQEALSTASE